MENINTEEMEKENMETNVNVLNAAQSDNRLNQQSIQNDSNAGDKSGLCFLDSEEVEVKKTFQRKPQFRFNENNKRKFS
nr:hypothetical protein [Bacteroidota bacterium]